MSSFLLQAKTPAPEDFSDANAIRVEVDYARRSEGITMAVYPAVSQRDGMVATLIMHGKHFLLEPTKRLNRKKVERWGECVEKQIDAKSGPAWEHLTAFLASTGLQLAD